MHLMLSRVLRQPITQHTGLEDGFRYVRAGKKHFKKSKMKPCGAVAIEDIFYYKNKILIIAILIQDLNI